MQHITNVQEIQSIMAARLKLEQDLAHALMGEFNQGQLKADLVAAVQSMLEFLVAQGEAATAIVMKREIASSFLVGLKAYGGNVISVLGAIRNQGVTFPLEHCGDLIRFYGEVIEDAVKGGVGGMFLEERRKQIAWRYGGGGMTWRAQQDPNFLVDYEKGVAEKDKKAGADLGGVWRRATKDSVSKSMGPGGRLRNRPMGYFSSGPKPFYDLVPGQSFDQQTFQTINGQASTGGGANQWVMTDDSTIKRIDMVFGLPFAADISGTTADCMYFLTGYMDLGAGRDPVHRALPLATIVSQYHHSLLEVAMAMSLKKVVTYQIGFYTSLMPALGSAPAHPGRTGVASVLHAFENRQENRHVLIYYTGSNKQIAGAFEADQSEYAAFKKAASCDISMWPRFNKMQAYPSRKDILDLMTEFGLRETATLRKKPIIYTPKALRGI